MATLYKRATPSQARILRIVEGAVKNASDAHRDVKFDRKMARSIAKRAAGTLTAQWPEVLAATSKPSGNAQPLGVRELGTTLRTLDDPGVGTDGLSSGKANRGRGAPQTLRRSPLVKVWGQLAILTGEAKRNGQHERANALIEALKIVAKEQNK